MLPCTAAAALPVVRSTLSPPRRTFVAMSAIPKKGPNKSGTGKDAAPAEAAKVTATPARAPAAAPLPAGAPAKEATPTAAAALAKVEVPTPEAAAAAPAAASAASAAASAAPAAASRLATAGAEAEPAKVTDVAPAKPVAEVTEEAAAAAPIGDAPHVDDIFGLLRRDALAHSLAREGAMDVDAEHSAVAIVPAPRPRLALDDFLVTDACPRMPADNSFVDATEVLLELIPWAGIDMTDTC